MTDMQIISKLLVNQSRVNSGVCAYGVKIPHGTILQFNKEGTKTPFTEVEFRQNHINEFINTYSDMDLVLEDLDQYNNPIFSVKKKEDKATEEKSSDLSN